MLVGVEASNNKETSVLADLYLADMSNASHMDPTSTKNINFSKYFFLGHL